MPGPLLLVIADPSAPFLRFLTPLQNQMRIVIAKDAETLKRNASEAEILLFTQGSAGLLDEFLPLASGVKWMHNLWTGVEGLMGPAVEAHPAPLTNGRGAFRAPLADWVTAAMLFFAFDLRRVIRQQEAGVWEPFTSTMLSGKTLGIIGYGSIGQAVAERARPFGMRILALRRRPDTSLADPLLDQVYGAERLDDLIAASDYVVSILPSTPQTRGMIGARQIAAMKPSAVLINIGRGPVIDEEALVQALKTSAIRGAALDVFNIEPLPGGHPFYKLPNVLLSPHTADRVEGFMEPAFQYFLENMERYRSGQPLVNVVDKRAGY